MTSSGPPPGSPGDGLDHHDDRDNLQRATRHLRALAVLLTRVFEAFAALPADGSRSADSVRPGDPDFWAGLQSVTADLALTAQEIQRFAEPAPPIAAEPAVMVLGNGVHANGTSDNGDDPSALCLASDLARNALDIDLGTIIEEHQDDWAALVHAVRAEKFRGDAAAPDDVEPLELYSKVITTLPVELRRDFRKLTEWRTADEIAERQAAFELGRQIERQARTIRR